MGASVRTTAARFRRWEAMGLRPLKYRGRITYDRTTYEYLKKMYDLPHRAPGDSDWLTDYLRGAPDA